MVPVSPHSPSISAREESRGACRAAAADCRPRLKTGFTDSAREQWYDRPLEGVGEGGVRGAGQVGQAGVGQQDRGVQTLANLNIYLTS